MSISATAWAAKPSSSSGVRTASSSNSSRRESYKGRLLIRSRSARRVHGQLPRCTTSRPPGAADGIHAAWDRIKCSRNQPTGAGFIEDESSYRRTSRRVELICCSSRYNSNTTARQAVASDHLERNYDHKGHLADAAILPKAPAFQSLQRRSTSPGTSCRAHRNG